MSLKSTAFTVANPHPQTIDRFTVMIPFIFDSPARCSATSMPQKKIITSSVKMFGREIPLPMRKTNATTWTCTLNESISGAALAQLKTLALYQNGIGSEVDVSLGSDRIKHPRYIEPIIFLTDAATGEVPIYWVALKNAYVESVQDLGLDWSKPDTPVKWQVTFRFTELKEFPLL